jgi:hypothetical protein
MITLKIIDDTKTGVMRANTVSVYGGLDMTQASLFNHLFPEGYCPWALRELLYVLAHAHGWNVEVTKK